VCSVPLTIRRRLATVKRIRAASCVGGVTLARSPFRSHRGPFCFMRVPVSSCPSYFRIGVNNPLVGVVDDLRDLWNQQTPFAISDELRPLFLQRMKDSLRAYDMFDRKQDWTPAALGACANVLLDDYILFDVTKPITYSSFF